MPTWEIKIEDESGKKINLTLFEDETFNASSVGSAQQRKFNPKELEIILNITQSLKSLNLIKMTCTKQ